MNQFSAKFLAVALAIGLVACSGESSFTPTDSLSEQNGQTDESPTPLVLDADAEIQAYAESFIQTYSLPGVIMAIADANKPLRIGASGVRAQGRSERITINDKIHLGSNTKAMTATLAARFVEKNRLRFNSTISEILPELTSTAHPDYLGVTLQQLLQHRSGMPANPDSWWINSGDPVSDIRWAIANTALTDPPAFQPGAGTLYSNLGYMIAGLMLEKTGQASWEELVAEEVFDPMGLTSAGFGPPDADGGYAQPWGHTQSLDGQYEPVNADNAPPLGPAGRVHMNFSDWSKFVLAHTSDGASLDNTNYLSARSWEILHTPNNDNYGLGWIVVNRNWAGGRTYTHSGSNTMWYTVAWVAPNLGRAFLVGTNSANANVQSVIDTAVSDLIGMQ